MKAILAYDNKIVALHSKIKVRISKKLENGEVISDTIESTVGRLYLMK